jgi:hypothetical protein
MMKTTYRIQATLTVDAHSASDALANLERRLTAPLKSVDPTSVDYRDADYLRSISLHATKIVGSQRG